MWALLREDSRRSRVAVGLGIYLLSTAVFFAFAAGATLRVHTPWNHFALLAEAWLEGRLDLAGPPPPYAGNNDFASFHDRWFVVFPPFPALLLLPLVAWARSAVRVQDGQFFVWLAGIAPAVLFLALEKLRRHGRSRAQNGSTTSRSPCCSPWARCISSRPSRVRSGTRPTWSARASRRSIYSLPWRPNDPSPPGSC